MNDTRAREEPGGATNLPLGIIERDEEWRLADVDVEGRVDDLDLPQVQHHPAQGGVIALAAIVLDDRRLVLVTGTTREAAAPQSTGQRINGMMKQR